MPEIQFEFTPKDNTKNIPEPISGMYELKTLVIEADTTEGLAEAIRKMRIYFRFDFFGSAHRNFSRSIHLSEYIWVTDELPTVIEFENVVFEITSKFKCENAIVSIADEIYSPITRMVLTIDHTEL